jgi:phosphomannomutase
MEKMQRILSRIRQNPLTIIDGQPLTFDDFAQGLYGLPKSDVLRFANETYRIIVRPSGTEPKMKMYLQAKAETKADALSNVEKALRWAEALIAD